MPFSWTSGTRMRAAVAVVALYGLLLQALLTSMASPPPAAGPGLSAICSPNGGDHASPDGQPTSHDRHGCCTAACAATIMATPAPSHGLVAWPRRDTTNVLWRTAHTILPTGPPVFAASARGPPTV